jgi:hypothetical protein
MLLFSMLEFERIGQEAAAKIQWAALIVFLRVSKVLA